MTNIKYYDLVEEIRTETKFMVIVRGFGVDGSIDAITHAINKASFKAVKVK